MKPMSSDRKLSGAIQVLDSFLAALDIGASINHPLLAGAFLLLSLWLLVQGVWNAAS